MFEFYQYDPDLHKQPAASSVSQSQSAKVERMSLLLWGEHCIECGAPACYSSCDLYEPRPDGACRRFEYGMYRNPAFSSTRNHGAEIQFRKWGKLEAEGNTCLMPVGVVRAIENAAQRLVPFASGLSRLLHGLPGSRSLPRLDDSVLERIKTWPKRFNGPMPDAFLIEAFNPGSTDVTLRFSMWINRVRFSRPVAVDQVPVPLLKTLVIPSGHFRMELTPRDYGTLVGSGLPFNISIVPEGAELPNIVFMTLDFVAYEAARQPVADSPKTAGPAASAKCVVFDLDNTLWDGVLLEQENVQLREGLKELIVALDERGILMSVASKNSHDHAWKKLENLGLAEYFLFPKINWLPKSQNIAQIAKELNIGLDTFVFIDDNPFEREQVGSQLPMVTCLDADVLSESQSLLASPRLKGSDSSDAKNRRRMYQEEQQRSEALTDYSSYIEFLRSSEITLEIRPYQATDFDRVAELVQRTNQLNFSGRKYKREEVAGVVADASLEKHVLICNDKYGSYGTVGFCLVRREPERVWVQDLMLSCRVQGKFIEQALFDYLLKSHAGNQPPARLDVNFKPTERNAPAATVLHSLGFVPAAGGEMVLNVADSSLVCDFINVVGKLGSVAADLSTTLVPFV